MAVETYQVAVEVLRSGRGARSHQTTIEVLRSGRRARAYQAIVEILRQKAERTREISVFQNAIEVLRRGRNVKLSSCAVEVLRRYSRIPTPVAELELVILKASATAEHVAFTLGLPSSLSSSFPRWRFSRLQCRWIRTTECQYANVCSKRLSECIQRGQVLIFGGFPAIPGGYFDA